MVDLGLAHVAARFRDRKRHAILSEDLDQGMNRRHAAEIDHGARPIQHHRLDGKCHAASVPKSSPITFSAMPKPVDAPVPLVTITSRTCGSGVSIR